MQLNPIFRSLKRNQKYLKLAGSRIIGIKYKYTMQFHPSIPLFTFIYYHNTNEQFFVSDCTYIFLFSSIIETVF